MLIGCGAGFGGTGFTGANLSADMKNPSMGRMRGALRQAKVAAAILAGAKLPRSDVEDADMTSARLTGLPDADPAAPAWAKILDRGVPRLTLACG